MAQQSKCQLSVIIPTLNEAQYLPRLLDALDSQTRLPDEMIVADAGSHDNTQAIAIHRGARIVPGGRPARGRNAGAEAARGDLLLFLDADVLPDVEAHYLAGRPVRSLPFAYDFGEHRVAASTSCSRLLARVVTLSDKARAYGAR